MQSDSFITVLFCKVPPCQMTHAEVYFCCIFFVFSFGLSQTFKSILTKDAIFSSFDLFFIMFVPIWVYLAALSKRILC